MNTSFLSGSNGSSTEEGPSVILVLENFTGNTSNIPLSAMGNISSSVSSDLLSEFEDPNNAGSLLAGIQTQNTSSTSATILGGLALQNSTVNASVDVAQLDDANVVLEGSVLELNDSTFNTSENVLNLNSSTFNASANNAAVQVSGGSSLNVEKNVVSANNGSDMNFANGLLNIQTGGTVTVGTGANEDLLATTGANTITSGDNFITVNGGTLNALRVSGNPSNMTLTINNGGLLALTNTSTVSLENGFGFVVRNIVSDSTFVSVENSQLQMGLNTDGVLARVSESFVVNSGGVLAVNNSGNVSVSSIIRGSGTTSSSAILNDTAVIVGGQSQVTADLAVNLDNLISATDLVLTVNDGGLIDLQNGSTASFDSLAQLAGSSIVTDETLATVDQQSTLVMNSEMISAVAKTISSDITVNNGGVLSLSNGSRYVDPGLLEATSPLVVLVQSAMSTGSGFLDVNSGSTLVANIPNDALVALDAGSLTVNGPLINVTGANSVVNVTGAIFDLQNGSILEVNGGALVQASAGGLFNLTGPLGRFGGGTAANPNILSVTNNICASSACQAPFAAFPELRVSGTVNVPQGYNPLQGFEPSGNQLNISENAAVLSNSGGTIELNN